MATLNDVVDELYITKRTSSPWNFDVFIKGVNSVTTRPVSSKRSTASGSSGGNQDSGRLRRQRIGDQLFEKQPPFGVVEKHTRRNPYFKHGIVLGAQIDTLLHNGSVTKEDIESLFNRELQRIPANELPVKLSLTSRLRSLFSTKVEFNPDAPLTEAEVDATRLFNFTSSSSRVAASSYDPANKGDIDIETTTIEQLLDTEVFGKYLPEGMLAEFQGITSAGEGTRIASKDKLERMSDMFAVLNRGDSKEARHAILLMFLAQCKAMEENRLFGESTARKYICFLVYALGTYGRRYNEALQREENVSDFLDFWRKQENKRQLREKVALDNKLWNDSLDLTLISDADIRFYGRFVRRTDAADDDGEFTSEKFLEHLKSINSPTLLPRSPINFPVDRAMQVVKEIGAPFYEYSLVRNIASWLVEGDDVLRIVLHDVILLRHCIEEALLRLRQTGITNLTPISQYASRRNLLAYMANLERTDDAKDNIASYIGFVKGREIINVEDDDDDDDAVGADVTVTTYPRPLETRLNHGIVVREASHLDHRRHRRRRRHSPNSDLYHVAAYKDTGMGKHVGYASYNSKTGQLVDLDYSEDRVREALIGAIQEIHPRCHGEIEKIGDDMTSSSSSSSSSPSTTTLTLKLSYDYKSLLAEAGQTNERPHVLMFWLTRSYSSTPPIVVNVERTRKGRQTFVFKVNEDFIPNDVSLNIDSYSHFTSETGNPMRNLAGSSYVSLAELVGNRGAPITLNLRVAASDVHTTKAKLTLQCDYSSLQPRSDSVKEDDDDQHSTCSLVKDYINSNHRFYENHPPISRSIAHTTVFKFRCRQNYVPGVLFDNFRLPHSQEAYYLNALKNALQLRLPQEPIKNIESAWQRVDSKLHTVLSMLTSYAVACKYLRDSVDNNVKGAGQWDVQRVEEIDSFDTVRHTDNGDCEDKTKEILLHAMELKYNSKSFKSPVFTEIRSILDNYVFCSTLCAVSQSSISKEDFNDRKEILDAHMSAHECAVAIPNYTFFSALRKSSPKHKLFDLYTQEEQNRGRGDRLYILEGTGSLAPEPRESTEYRDEIQFAYEKSVPHRHLTGQIFYDIDSDDIFYKIIVNLMTPEFYLRTGYIGFEFLVINEEGKRGAFFSDLMNISNDSQTKVMITETPRLSPLTFNRSMRVTDDNFPLVTLEAPLEIPRAILRIAERLTFQTNEERKEIPRHEDCYIVQCLFEYMTEEKIVSIIKGAQSQRLNVVCYVEALKLDYVTKQVFGRYTLIFY